jgi:hypothetical protein
MDVHPPKNGMYRYWSIAIFRNALILAPGCCEELLSKGVALLAQKCDDFAMTLPWLCGNPWRLGHCLTSNTHRSIHRIAILFAKYLKPPIRSLHVAWPWFLGSGDKGWRLVAGLQSASSEPTAAQKLYKARAKSCFLRQIFALYKNIHHDQSWSIMINHTTSCFDPYLVRRVPKSMIAFQRCSGGLQSFVSAAALLQHHPKHSPEGCWSINQRIPRWKPEHPELTPREEI